MARDDTSPMDKYLGKLETILEELTDLTSAQGRELARLDRRIRQLEQRPAYLSGGMEQ